MNSKKLMILYAIVLAVVAVPLTAVHIMANPDDTPISPLQRAVAAIANVFGPWGVAIVRLVDFPNAGMRSFSWPIAIGLTLFGATLVAVPLLIKKRPVQYAGLVLWTFFLLGWFAIGLGQIANGLL